MEIPKWESPPKVIENDSVKVLWDFQIQIDQPMANHPSIVLVSKLQKKAVVIDIAIQSDCNIKENNKLEK